MKTITIEGELRSDTGKKATRQIRSKGLVPGLIYGGAKQVKFTAPVLAFKQIVYTPDFQFAEIKINGNNYRCILKDIQFNKVTERLDHIDFLELVEDKKVIATIPIKFTGIAAGVKGGGKLETKMKNLRVKTFPKYLRENIEVDLTDLELNENIRVEDVKDPNYEILNSPRIPIASVVLTRVLKQEEATVPGAAAPGTPGSVSAATTATTTPGTSTTASIGTTTPAPTAKPGAKEKGKK